MTGVKRFLRKPRRGLTLMELLVVLGVFSSTVAMTSAIFLQANRAQRRVLGITAAQADLRFAMEAIVREMRAGRIDYGRYAASGGVSLPADRLFVLSADGRRLEFFVEDDAATCPAGVSGCLAIRVDDDKVQAVTSAGVSLDRAVFVIDPPVDPFALDEDTGLYLADRQPTVTVALRARTAASRPEDVVVMDMQTTVSARTYVR